MPQQRIVRNATEADFRAIYDLQKSPRRDLAFPFPLPEFEYYIQELSSKIESGAEIYYVMEADSKIISFLWFSVVDGRLWGNCWGRWIKTLFFAAIKIAFEILKYPRIYFAVRKDNQRVCAYFEERGLRKIGETQGIIVRERDMIVAVSNVYELTYEEFLQIVVPSREQAFDVVFEGLPVEQ
jgi:hypothetical protein